VSSDSAFAQVLGKVVLIAGEDDEILYVEHGNGSISRFIDPLYGWSFDVGDVVLCDFESNSVEAAPAQLWQDWPWLGVVQHVNGGDVVVDRLLSVQTVKNDQEDLEVKVGNTVEVHPSRGLTRIVSESSLSSRDSNGASDLAEQYKTPPDQMKKHSFDDFGGLDTVKRRVRELIETPLERHELLNQIGAKPIKGVLFTGEPGTGKTMLARIVASRANATFYEISGPEIFNKWYGESERVVRAIFADAASQERAIVFFDEIDSVAGRRNDESHEVSRRVVAQLLTAMDGFKASESNTVVVATTNRPQDIDPALRRPGRFDWEINFPLPGLLDREQILEVSCRTLRTAPNLDHSTIAAKTDGWRSADLSAIFSEAALLTVTDGRAEIRNEEYFLAFERVLENRSRLENESQ
jgi:transitional endoplasmic reticulum ATPase